LNKLYQLKFNSGEEIITELVKMSPKGDMIIKNPLKLKFEFSQESQSDTMMFSPFIMDCFGANNIVVNSNSVSVTTLPSELLTERYLQTINYLLNSSANTVFADSATQDIITHNYTPVIQ